MESMVKRFKPGSSLVRQYIFLSDKNFRLHFPYIGSTAVHQHTTQKLQNWLQYCRALGWSEFCVITPKVVWHAAR